MKHCTALVLAAGKGTRMKSRKCKVIHPVAGRPMIHYVMESLVHAGVADICVVVGHEGDAVRERLGAFSATFVEQEPQLGTGHAVAAARSVLEGRSENVLILCGDTPLIRPQTIEALLQFHLEKKSQLTVVTTIIEDPTGYGRIIREQSGTHIAKIVEERDASPEEKNVKEINTGMYVASSPLLYPLIDAVRPDNAQGEYYLTDIVEEAVKRGVAVWPYKLQRSEEALGVNRRSDLAKVSCIVWDEVRQRLMDAGVTLLDPAATYIDPTVTVGPDTVIYPCTFISGATVIGSDCVIESGVHIMDSAVGDRVRILQGSRLNNVVVRDGASIGPMAHLRPESDIGRDARIGNFVEVKKTRIGDGTKASHLTYLGDSTIGRDVNIGCGTITCNYDGRKKHPTIIHDRCFVGSDVQFVAPVEIGEGSLIGAGSTITKDVPPRSLAVARSRQKIYPLREDKRSGSGDEGRQP
ncbi:MAG: bifunctional UDP-N-acetylglucosamine diphosphorylase/glucosamine-1-phosphate N-acetyltransferase GlmU [Desulfomonilaceae bacterium]